MLGYTERVSSDVYIFFENDEIERLEKERIRGTYFNLRAHKVAGLLEASVNDKISDKIVAIGKKNNKGLVIKLNLQMKTTEYQRLKERRTAGLHEGFRHIELLDSNCLNSPGLLLNYQQLKSYESLHKKHI
jgi:hypothetical protein